MLEGERLIKKFAGAPEGARVVFITGSGTASMEATIMNVLMPQGRVLVVNGGSFGHRFCKLCEVHGVPHDEIKLNVGEQIKENHLEMFECSECSNEKRKYTALLLNKHETSTGVHYDMKLISEFCKRNGMMLIVDNISSFLADEFNMAELGADVMIAGSQKALACPPGVSVIVLSARALDRVAKNDYDEMRHWPLRKFYHNSNGSLISARIENNPPKDLVFVGRISIQKNLINLIDAVEIAKRHLDLYGPIDEREVSHADEFRRKLENAHYAHYCGALKAEEVYDVLGQYKCFVNPSWSEASPVAVMEAGANGLYLYLSDVAGHRNLGFPDVHYFPAKKIDLPTVDMVRSDSNIQWHREHLSIEANLARYEALYNSFERKK